MPVDIVLGQFNSLPQDLCSFGQAHPLLLLIDVGKQTGSLEFHIIKEGGDILTQLPGLLQMVPGHIYVCGVRDKDLAKLQVSTGFHLGWGLEGEEGL